MIELATGAFVGTLTPQKMLCVVSNEGEVEWTDDASPAAIMDPAQHLDGQMRAALLALWYATH